MDKGLQPRQDHRQLIITDFFKLTQNSSTEEHLGVAQAIFLCFHCDGFQTYSCSSLVFFGSIHLLCSQDIVAVSEVCVGYPVGEALTADTNTLKYTITGELV